MTRTQSLLSAIALGFFLPSCESADVRNPNVEQMDQLDVQWGLPTRTSKGGAKRLLPANETFDAAPAAGTPAVAPANPAAALPPAATNLPAAAPAGNTVDPAIINTLR